MFWYVCDWLEDKLCRLLGIPDPCAHCERKRAVRERAIAMSVSHLPEHVCERIKREMSAPWLFCPGNTHRRFRCSFFLRAAQVPSLQREGGAKQ